VTRSAVINGMTLINDFLSLLYPRTCEACNATLFAHEKFICGECRLSLPKSGFHRRKNHELLNVFAGRVPFISACSFYTYEKRGRVQRLLHAIKYRGQKELAEFLGSLYAEDLKCESDVGGIDVVIPIPLHKKKLRSRGFNQSEWFARGLSAGLDRPLECNVFQRRVETSTQTRKRKYARWENVAGIFELRDRAALYGKHVLLVDDVITTGATIEAAWTSLRETENIRLSVASIAFAPKMG
jgi:ComF family protein